MIKNLIVVALRNFKRDYWYSMLNILGLTIGIAFSLFLIFYINDELSYDKHHEKKDRIFRINSFVQEPEKEIMKWAITPFPMGPALQKDFPEVEEFVRFVPNSKEMFKYGDVRHYEEKIYFTDSSIFKIFTHPFLEGDAQTALTETNSIVLTKRFAEKYFGKEKNVVGKVLQNDEGENYKITGVIDDVPGNSHISFNALISISTLPKNFASSWGQFGFYTYVLLRPHTNHQTFEDKLASLYETYLASLFGPFNITMDFGAQNITDIHLRSETTLEPEELGSMSYIYIFAAVAFFMLIIACINYMNLTTARSARRAKEIGIRKVTGSSQSQLVAQFLVESTLTALFALVLSLIVIAVFLPTFNQLSGKEISIESLFDPSIFLILLLIVLFVGLIGGSYPSFYLSKFNPVHVLKGSLSKGSSNVILRRALIVVQFSISMIMLICTWIVYDQLNYVRNKDLGFNKEHVLSLTANTNDDVKNKVSAFKNEVQRDPKVLSVSSSQAIPGAQGVSFNLFSVETKNGLFTETGVDCYGVDENYFNTLGMKITEGRNFENPSDTMNIIVNEKMVEYFGWDEPIGKKVKFPDDTTGLFLTVIGVVKDFNQKSLYNPIAPLLLFHFPYSKNIQVKIDPQNISGTLSSIERTWSSIFPDLPFTYTFLDQDFNSQYAADQKRGKIFTAFSVLTIVITCLGLLGLIAFTTQQRQKEISIRKVMGADVIQIVPLFANNFILLVAISCLIAFPVAYLFMNKWLSNFPFNTGINPQPFIFSALTVLIIALITVTFHTVRAAISNPVKNLRTE